MTHLTKRLSKAICQSVIAFLAVLLTAGLHPLGGVQIVEVYSFDLPTHGYPSCFVSRDMNGDGYPDVIMGSNADNELSLLYNDKGTGFAKPVVSIVKDPPTKIVTGDVNGDGIIDVVGINPQAGPVVYLGAKDGTFKETASYKALMGSATVVLADLNGDHKLDMIALGIDSSKVSVLLGNGDGTFGAPISYDGGAGAADLKVADMNGGHIPDLIISTSDPKTQAKEVLILPGKGDGTFGDPIVVPVDAQDKGKPGTLATADLNKDGLRDIVVVSHPGGSAGDVISALIANPAGGGYTEKFIPAGFDVVQIALTDTDGDGVPDIIALNHDSGTISEILNNGAATSFTRADYVVTPCPEFMTVADFDKDKWPDTLCFSKSQDGLAYNLIFGHPGGTLPAPTSIPLGFKPGSIALGDFNGDGTTDIVACGGDAKQIGLLIGNGRNAFTQSSIPVGDFKPTHVVAADFNGDGKLDLAVADNANPGAIQVYLGQGDGLFKPGPIIRDPALKAIDDIQVADLNNDGKPDLVIGEYDAITVLIDKGNGSFRITDQHVDMKSSVTVAIGDIDGDKIPDIAAVESYALSSYVWFYKGQGDGTFQERRVMEIAPHATHIALRDMNDDDRVDLVASFGDPVEGSISIYENTDSAFDFTGLQTYAVDADARYFAFDDFDKDGLTDILVSCREDNSICFLKNLGGGRYGQSISTEGGYGPGYFGLGDVNGDGKADLIVPDSTAGALAIILNGTITKRPTIDPRMS